MQIFAATTKVKKIKSVRFMFRFSSRFLLCDNRFRETINYSQLSSYELLLISRYAQCIYLALLKNNIDLHEYHGGYQEQYYRC